MLQFFVKFCQNFQNTPHFLGKKNFKDLVMGQNLIEFTKIHMPKYLKIL
jgi:hypothetical protein